MKRITLFFMYALFCCVDICAQIENKHVVMQDSTPKMHIDPTQDCNNPILDFNFNADPTAIVHNGRVYVYGTNDQQQCDSVGEDNENNYAYIKTLVMASTNDMVNWTYHGTIKTTEICKPWAGVSWAPSIISRKESDGKTHFYMFFANGGSTGMISSTSPVGPWSDPKGRTFFDWDTPELNGCSCPFDPGAVIDDKGQVWVSFGGGDKNKLHGTDLIPGNARIAKLTPDMLGIESVSEIPAPYHFEANELDYINGKWVYTYNTNWMSRNEWPYNNADGKPSTCSMVYMTSTMPMQKDSWTYENNYLKNPGEYGMSYCNNHTHLLKYEGQWYIFYHNLLLKDYHDFDGGFRSICVDKIDVDEKNVKIKMTQMTRKGVDQIRPLNPFQIQQTETVAGTLNATFAETETVGNTVLDVTGANQTVMVRGAKFSKSPKQIVCKVKGHGSFKVCIGTPDSQPVAKVSVNSNDWKNVKASIKGKVRGQQNVYFISENGNYQFDEWKFE